jgi:quercetin dioxygenase-like cupin family protein
MNQGEAAMSRTPRKWTGIFAVASLATAVLTASTVTLNDVAADPPAQSMKIVRLYTGTDNQSHFEDLEVPMKSNGKIGFLSEKVKASGLVFRYTTGEYNYEFHTAPRRQYVVNLEGEVEIEVGDGTKRILRSGDVLLAEDTTGQGHISRAVEGKPRRSLFITLD